MEDKKRGTLSEERVRDSDEEIGESEKKKQALALPCGSVPLASRKGFSGGNIHSSPPSCQADECAEDLTNAKRYHKRHKVCEYHAKAAVALVSGLHQRFCQQCSRFHELPEFDESKRSCRRRLAGHNERRRKVSSESQNEGSDSSRKDNNHCRHTDQNGRIEINFPGNPNYENFQIR